MSVKTIIVIIIINDHYDDVDNDGNDHYDDDDGYDDHYDDGILT